VAESFIPPALHIRCNGSILHHIYQLVTFFLNLLSWVSIIDFISSVSSAPVTCLSFYPSSIHYPYCIRSYVKGNEIFPFSPAYFFSVLIYIFEICWIPLLSCFSQRSACFVATRTNLIRLCASVQTPSLQNNAVIVFKSYLYTCLSKLQSVWMRMHYIAQQNIETKQS
jgi:hypothetical protein